MNLFQRGDFTLRSGKKSGWKIECHALTANDWDALALMASEILPPFGNVVGVPKGGIPFAASLAKFVDPNSSVILIAEDVVTTGDSMERTRDEYRADALGPIIGVAAFCRGRLCPSWVAVVFHYDPTPYELRDLAGD